MNWLKDAKELMRLCNLAGDLSPPYLSQAIQVIEAWTEFLQAVARGPYSDSDPASLLKYQQVRAKALLGQLEE